MNTRKILFPSISIMTAILLAFACSDRNDEVRQQMDRAESLFQSRPDSALIILDSISPETLGGKREKARYALLKSIALDKNYIDTTDFSVLRPAIDYFPEKGSPDEKLKTYYYQGRIYQNKGESDSAFNCFIRAREFSSETTDTLAVANLLVAQAAIFYSTYKLEEYTWNHLEAARLYKDIGRTDYELDCLGCALSVSMATEKRGRADSIINVMRRRIDEIHESSHEILDPFLITYTIKFGTRRELEEILKNYRSTDIQDNIMKMDIAEAYRKIGDAVNSRRFLDAVGPGSQGTASLKYLATKPDILALGGDDAGALAAFREFLGTIDSIHQEIFNTDLLFAEERHRIEKAGLMEINQRDRIILISLSTALALLVAIVIIYYRYRLSRSRIKLEEQEKERLKLEQENLGLQIKQLKDESATLKELLEEGKNLGKPIEDAIKIRIEMLNSLLASRITNNATHSRDYQKWSERLIKDKENFMNSTRAAFEATHPEFMKYLKKTDLTDQETDFVCLYAIGLRGTEIGEYLQQTRHYHISSGIRRKLGIDSKEPNIGIYIRRLLEEL